MLVVFDGAEGVHCLIVEDDGAGLAPCHGGRKSGGRKSGGRKSGGVEQHVVGCRILRERRDLPCGTRDELGLTGKWVGV
jgi:hypothetical protein